jgi:serine/threonine protein kinase
VAERIGAYEVVRLIARGGMATVYEAYQPTLDRSVALKRLDLRSSDPMQTDRFIQESRMSAAFSHPNIVTVFDFFEFEGVPYIAMEYLPRGSLRDCIERLSLAQVFGVVECVLKGLAHAQEDGVAHRDLKPENLLLTRTGAVKIADFGIAKAYYNATVQFSATGMAIGTPTYMAPEQATSAKVGPYTDIYALGVMVYEMLSGEPPFKGGDSPVSVMYKHVAEPPPPLTDCDPRVAAWVARLLEKDPADRPSDAVEAWREIEPTIVDLLGPFWRNDATLGEIPKQEYEEIIGGEATPTPDAEPVAPPDDDADDYVTVAGAGGLATPEPDSPPAPEPEPTPEPSSPTPEPTSQPSPPAPEPISAGTPEPEAPDDYVTVAGDARDARPAPEPTPPTPAPPPPPEPSPPEPTPEPTPPEPTPPAPEPELPTPREHIDTPPTGPITLPPPDADDGAGRGRRVLVVAGAVVAVVVVVVAVIALGGGGDDDGNGGGGGGGGEPTTEAAAPFAFSGDGPPVVAAGTAGAADNAGAVTIDGVDAPLTDEGAGPGARYGAAIASADFDSDGQADLAIGAPGAEAVTVLAGAQNAQSTKLPGGGRFGAALAAGDVNGDDFPDLVVGAPDGDGVIHVFLGGSEGLSRDRSQSLEPAQGLAGRFGTVLAVGDINGDDIADIAEAGGKQSGYCLGGAGGPQSCEPLGGELDQPITALAIGDVTGDGFGDIVQGIPEGGDPVPDEPDTGVLGPPGLLQLWPGGENAPADEPILMTQDTAGVRGNDQANDRFGAALAIGDLDGDDFADMVVGAPGEDSEFGRLTVVRGGERGHADEDGFGYGSKTPDLAVTIEAGSHLGEAVALRDLDGDGTLDLIAAAPGNPAVVTLPGVGDGEFTGSGSTSLDLPDGASDVSLGGNGP